MLAKWKKDVNILSNPHKYGCPKNDRQFKMKVWWKKDSPAEVLQFWLCQMMTRVRLISEFHFKFIDQLAQISILAWVVVEYQLFNGSQEIRLKQSQVQNLK